MAHPDAESNSYPLAYCSVLWLLFQIKIASQTSVGRNNDVTPQVLGCGAGGLPQWSRRLCGIAVMITWLSSWYTAIIPPTVIRRTAL